MKKTKEQRLTEANALLAAIAQNGRELFRTGNCVAYLEIDVRGKIWFVDDWNKKKTYTHYQGHWKNFTHGGTLKSLIKRLRDYVSKGTKFSVYSLGYRPDWRFSKNANHNCFGYSLEQIRFVWKKAIESEMIFDVELELLQKFWDRLKQHELSKFTTKRVAEE